VLQKQTPDATVLPAPVHTVKGNAERASQVACAPASKTVNELARTTVMVVIELTAGPLQIAVVIQELQPAERLLFAASDKGGEITRTQKAVNGNMPHQIVVTFREL
jgi:hypothetical protein